MLQSALGYCQTAMPNSLPVTLTQDGDTVVARIVGVRAETVDGVNRLTVITSVVKGVA